MYRHMYRHIFPEKFHDQNNKAGQFVNNILQGKFDERTSAPVLVERASDVTFSKNKQIVSAYFTYYLLYCTHLLKQTFH